MTMAIDFYYHGNIFYTRGIVWFFLLPWKFIQMNQNGDTKGVGYIQGV